MSIPIPHSPFQAPVPAVNYHLWKPCNMRCKFCFATYDDYPKGFLPKGHLPQAESEAVVRALVQAGFSKITFAGGEPTLCPWLPELIRIAKEGGMTTMIVTNGTKINPSFINETLGTLDWVTFSVDSLSQDSNSASGRAVPGKGVLTGEEILSKATACREAGMRIKLNTVVSAWNHTENLSDWVRALAPERWKIFQALPVEGQNHQNAPNFLITGSQFQSFLDRHSHLNSASLTIVPENNDAMTGSYAMVDPAGRFYDNVNGRYRYSSPILQKGISQAWSEVYVSEQKFHDRGGEYDW